jgi:hypothetical protein
MTRSNDTRRDWLIRAGLLATGFLAGRYAPRSAKQPLQSAAAAAYPRHSCIALSLAELQRRARAVRNRGKLLSEEITTLASLNSIHGFTVHNSDVILLGSCLPQGPVMHIDDLMVALRSAWRTDSVYNQPPGCTIDPRMGDADPWAIHDVKVLGQPSCRMARRHVALDYELKRAGAGLVVLGAVRSSFDIQEHQKPLCEYKGERATSVTSRYWFCTKYPVEKIRYAASPSGVTIEHPVGVQVQTERMMENGGPGAGADPEAERFAGEVSALIASGQRPDYCQIVNDFRLIELGVLLRYENVPTASLLYLLQEHEPEIVDIPRYVVGIRRTETSELVCSGGITITGQQIRASLPVTSRSLSYRGGVEALVEIAPLHFTRSSSDFARTVEKIVAARPSPDSLTWEIQA